MSEFEIIETMVGVPIDALLNAVGFEGDVVERIEAMRAMGQETVDLAEIVMDGGYQIVIIPMADDDEESSDLEDWEDEDEDEEEEEERTGLGGLLDRLRDVFGKAISFEAENKMIAQNRRKAAAREPHDFQPAVYATRKGVIRCRVCGSAASSDGAVLCSGIVKDLGYGMSLEGDEEYVPLVPLGELTLRSAVMAETNDMIADAIGCWTQSAAHYFDQSPWVDEGIACGNCVAFCPEMGGCHWVEGMIDPAGICKLWVIPEEVRKAVAMKTENGEQYSAETLPEVLKAEMFTPPKSVQEEAQRAVRWIEQGFQGKGFTPTGRRRASDLAAGKAVSYDIIQRIDAFLVRHRTDRQSPGWSPGEKGYPSPGRVAWAAWGGDAARSWVDGINRSMEKDSPSVNDVHVDVPMGSGRKKKNPVPSAPAIAGLFSKSDARKFTLGPWYVPDSYDAHGEWTDSDELQSALWNYVRNGDRQIRLQHNVDVVAGEWVEALTWPYPVTVPMTDAGTGMMVEQEFPAGTVFMGVVWEDWAWDLVKEGKIRGYSMGGSGQRVTVDLPSEGQV